MGDVCRFVPMELCGVKTWTFTLRYLGTVVLQIDTVDSKQRINVTDEREKSNQTDVSSPRV